MDVRIAVEAFTAVGSIADGRVLVSSEFSLKDIINSMLPSHSIAILLASSGVGNSSPPKIEKNLSPALEGA